MAKENDNDIEIPDEENLEGLDDATDWKAKADELQKKHREAGIRNRERTKALRDTISALEQKLVTPPAKETKKPDEELLKRLDKLALKTSGIHEADEVELFEKWRTETGRDAEGVIESPIFKKELEEIRIAKANQKATSDIKGKPGESGARNTPEYWIAKATKGSDGKLLFPEETPKELYAKIVDKLSEQGSNSRNKLQFYNE